MSDEKLVEPLNKLLANHAVYYQKLRNYHWNVKGPAFFQLHNKFEEMYLASQEHVDLIAERILALGGHPYSTMQSFLDNATIKEDAKTPDAQTMVKNLASDIKSLREHNRKVKSMADEVSDDTTVNLLDDILDAQAENGWMLRAWLG